MGRAARLAVLTVLALGVVAGCTADPPARPAATGSPSPSGSAPAPASGPADALAALRAGVTFPDRVSFRTDLDLFGQLTTVTWMDSPGRRSRSTMSLRGKTVLEMRVVDADLYLKAEPSTELPGSGKGWLKLDPTRVPAGFRIGFATGQNDPGGAHRLVKAVNEATRSGADGITGTIDLGKVGTGNGVAIPPQQVNLLGEAAKRAPYTASLDAEGRLTSFVITIAGGGRQETIKLGYSDFGGAVAVARPAGNVPPAPEAIYAKLGV